METLEHLTALELEASWCGYWFSGCFFFPGQICPFSLPPVGCRETFGLVGMPSKSPLLSVNALPLRYLKV